MYLYTGGYTRGRSEGIGLARFDPETGAITPVEGVAEIVNPSFLAATADGDGTLLDHSLVLYGSNKGRTPT